MGRAGARRDCRCIILTGAGERAFTVGADVSGDLSAGAEVARMVNHALLKNDAYSKPIVAAVNGDCVGGGLELMLSTDIRAAVPEARFGLTEVKWSIYPFVGSTIKLIQQIGYVHAMDLLLTARLIDAGEAARLGLVNRLVAQRADAVGDRDSGNDRCKQPIGGAGGQAASQRHDRRPRVDPRGPGAAAWRRGASQPPLCRGHLRVPREAKTAL